MKCLMCGCEERIVLEDHHNVPEWLVKLFPQWQGRGGTTPLCANCHRKVHYLLNFIKEVLELELQK